MKTIKYFAMTLMGAFFLTAASAQDDDMNKKAESGDISIGFNYDLTPNVNLGAFGVGGGGGGTPSTGNHWRNDAFGNAQIFGRYYLSSDLAIRAGLGINSTSTTDVSKDSSNWSRTVTDSEGSVTADSDSASYSEVTTETGQFNFSIAPGIEKHFSTGSNIDPYVGAQIPIAILGGMDSTVTQERSGYDASGTEVSYDSERSLEMSGGFGWGVQGIVGFNWFVDDKVSIGMEYKLGFMSTSQGGETTGTLSEEADDGNVNKSVENDTWSHQTESTEGGLNTMSRGGINVSIFF